MKSRWLLFGIAFALLACSDDAPQGPPPVVDASFIDPVWEYDHSVGNSITGGYVYRGSALPELVGSYIYADFGNGKIWSLRRNGDTWENEFLFGATALISTFGVDPDGEILVGIYGNSRRLRRLAGRNITGSWTYSTPDAYPHLFQDVVDIRTAGDSRVFVVEQSGQIWVFDSASADPPTVFLDLSKRVTDGGELGLLGLAFPDDYATRGQFFVYYTIGTGPWQVRLCRFDVSADPDAADPVSEVLLLAIEQTFANHNGGALAFDQSGHLLVGVGDEGSGGDPLDHGQDPADLHGAILRLDVDYDVPPYYRIPADNPSALGESDFAPEVFAYGLRNPWRMSVDPTTGEIWVGDVGQGKYEEIDLIEAGGNYGWDCREGFHPYAGPPGGPSSACSADAP